MMKLSLFAYSMIALMFLSATAEEDELRQKAEKLAHEILIIDTHIDVPYRLWNQMQDISQRTESGNFDYPRAVSGGLNAAFFAIYVPSSYEEKGGARALADSLIDMVEEIVSKFPKKFALASSIEDVKRSFSNGKISILLGIENGTAIEGDLGNLKHFFDRGVRYITLTHALDNNICDSSYDTTRTWKGLSPLGRKVVKEMNRIGCLIDVSHVTDDAFYQIIELSKAPLIASHSSCRHFTPGFERNMSDDMIKKLAESGGVLQINFGSTFLRDDIRKKMDAGRKQISEYMEANNLKWGDGQAQAYIKEYREEHSIGYADISDIADHIDHVVEVAGIDHVGLGSDFDGLGDSLPAGLKDVSGYPNLIYLLLKRGYSEGEIIKICSGNILRVWAEAERVARLEP